MLFVHSVASVFFLYNDFLVLLISGVVDSSERMSELLEEIATNSNETLLENVCLHH